MAASYQQVGLVGILLSVIYVSVNWYLYKQVVEETYHFHQLSNETVHHQKHCLGEFLDVFFNLSTPMLLIDLDILPLLFRSRPPAWHKSDHKCKQLCKLHPEEKHVVSFAVEAAHFMHKRDTILSDLAARNFSLHLSLVRNETSTDDEYLPTYLWLAKYNHIIQLAFLHRINSHVKHAEYLWVGPITDEHWKETVETLAPVLTDGWHDMERLGLKFPRYDHAFDISHNLLAVPTEIDGHRVAVPYHLDRFVQEYKASKFLKCNRTKAEEFQSRYHDAFPPLAKDEIRNYTADVVEAVRITKYSLDITEHTFWLTGDLLLDWYRECNISILPKTLEFGVWASEFDKEKVDDLVEKLEYNGLVYLHAFGKLSDSYEMSFHLKSNAAVEINLFFFYDHYIADQSENNGHVIWYGRTNHKVNQKYKFHFSRPEFCWTEFAFYKVRVPCDTHEYITTMYGDKWEVVGSGISRRYEEAKNVYLNGYWLQKEWKEAIYHHNSSAS